jgi:predicted nucleotidyltransferase component of viral defense system
VTTRAPTNLPASVRDRLRNVAKRRGEELQTTLTRYGVERLLYRLSQSDVRDRFILKGAVLFEVWDAGRRRPTRDVDFLGYGPSEPERIARIFRSLCHIDVESDGLIFHAETVRAEPIRETQDYGGIRVTLRATLGTARIPLQIDIGFGDVVTPEAETVAFPTLLTFPAPTVRAYPAETVIAETYQAMTTLGIINTRMKDFYDVYLLSDEHAFDGATLVAAISATFARRDTVLPVEPPVALTRLFGDDAAKATQWRAFLNRSRLVDTPAELGAITDRLHDFLWPLTNAARGAEPFAAAWLPGIGWTPS